MPITPNDPEYQDIMRRHREGKHEERAKAKRKAAKALKSAVHVVVGSMEAIHLQKHCTS